jgi:D-xylose 1-dehydrogenase (NADP+, D-xylono-1,5-lactone-forming)
MLSEARVGYPPSAMSDERKVGWGIIGCGWIGTDAVAPAIQWSSNGRVVAVASRDPRLAEAKARQIGAARSYAPYEALLEDRGVDAVYIGLPNGMHEEWAIRCAQAGKHVLCEKSLTMTLASAERIREAFRRRGLHLVEAFMYRHHPQWSLVRDLIDAGAVGKVRVVRGSFCGRFDKPENHRWSASLGGGALWDLTCYPIDAARYITRDEVVRVAATADTRTPEGVDAVSTAALELRGGVIASATGSLAAGFDQSVVVVGEDGVLQMSDPFTPGWERTRIGLRRRETERHFDVPGANQFLHQVEHFAALVLDRERAAWPAEDGVQNVATCEAVEKSWRTGAAVAIPAAQP